jgi:hypothetical protein
MRLTNTIRDAFIRAAMDDVPSVDYSEKIRQLLQKDAAKQLPPKVRAIYHDPELRHFVSTTYCYKFDGIHVPCGGNKFDPSPEAQAEYERLDKERDAQKDRNKALRDKLHAVAYSVSTRKALVDALPEFEKYLPADDAAACRTLPVVANVVSEFVKAGWPKGRAKTEAPRRARA